MYLRNVKEPLDKNKKMKLFQWNKYAIFAHTLSFLVIVLLYSYYDNSKNHVVAELYRSALPKEDDLNSQCNSTGGPVPQGAGQCVTAPILGVPKKANVSFNVIYGCLFFFAFTAFAHLYYYTDGFKTGAYTKVIMQGWNPYRWVEYGVSASVMSVLIGYALGITEFPFLANLALLTAGMQASGYVVESALRQPIINREVVLGATVGGWLLFTAMWGPLLYTFWSRVNDVNLNYNGIIDSESGKPLKVPNFVWFIVAVQLFNYASFGLIQLKQVRAALKDMPLPFTKIESDYLKLSFVGKLGLAGGLAYGLIYRTKDCTT